MNYLSDEILNKYIDNGLSAGEILAVNEKLKISAYDRNRLKVLTAVHKNLENLEIKQVKPDFTFSMMEKIRRKVKRDKEQKRFFIIVLSLLAAACIAIVISAMGGINSVITPQQDLINESLSYINKNSTEIAKFISGLNFTLLGYVTTFILLVSVYLLLEQQKNKTA